jgi:thiol:disulfide interchange protein DsbA
MKTILAGLTAIAGLGILTASLMTNAEEGAPAPASADSAPNTVIVLEEGKNFRTVKPAQPTKSGDQIEVMEIFWYGCPHCHDFEPYLAKWLESKPADVSFSRMPGIFRESWIPAARAFYTAEALGIFDKMHPALFKAIHEEQRGPTNNEEWGKFFGELGVTEADFAAAWDSVEVAQKVRETMSQVQNYGIEGVPAVVIAGKYQTSAGMEGVGSFDAMLKVVSALVDKARTEAKPAE